MSPAAGAQALEIEVEKTVEEINAAAISRGDRALNVMRNVEIETLSKEGSGRVYKRGKKGFQVASAPGETPAPDSGTLRRDWVPQKLIGRNGGGVRIILRLTSSVFYQTFLERGTTRMAPRPHMEKIKQKSIPQVATLFSNL